MNNTATLLISCPDKKGIVASVANFLYEHNANILHADEHQDNENKLFFLRTEWDLMDFSINREEFKKLFTQTAKKFQMDWKIRYSSDKLNVALFLSKEDHCLADLLYRYKNNEINFNIKMTISNYPNAKELSEFYNIPFYEIPSTDNREKDEQKILSVLGKSNIDLIILARYMKIFSPEFIQKFGNPIINIHHSFLPSFVGARPYHQAYERGVKIIGATAHYVTAELDQGPIIDQDTLRISHRDSIENLIQKGKDIEKIVLSRAVKSHIEDRVLIYGNKTVVFD
ncbi:MAG TPA: formyltetrahydrofolate deformylase [Candidatus Saccharimonadales bacterium]|nr:formyltetrahydrofolate deformylase [Candidatus Saccharimonadales bacterium]